MGPGLTIDTDRYFVVCPNTLGECQGSTGPASINPDTGTFYGPDFPQVSIRDQVRAQAKLADILGIDSWLSCVGGSMGGMQALEWAVSFPKDVDRCVCIASAVNAQLLEHQLLHPHHILDHHQGKGDAIGLAGFRIC